MADEPKEQNPMTPKEGEQPESPQDEAADMPMTNGEQRHHHMAELTRAYERARDELNEAIRNIRAELARIDLDQARTRARDWVDENPTLAVFLGMGAGIIAGRLIGGAFRPDPLPVRARKRALHLAADAGDYASGLAAVIARRAAEAAQAAVEAGEYVARRTDDAAGSVSRTAARAGKDLSKQAQRMGKDVSKRAKRTGKELSHRTTDLGHVLSKHASTAGGTVSRRAADVGESMSRRAEEMSEIMTENTSRSIRALEDAADDLTKTLKKTSKQVRKQARKGANDGLDLSNSMLNAARTAVAAIAVKKASDWMKRIK